MNRVYYTDGACSGNPGPGGWAFVELVKDGDGLKTECTSGGKEQTTNNEMELTAVYKALVKSYKQGDNQVTIYSDSAYVVNAISKLWVMNWKQNGWNTAEGKKIKNRHIWEKMYELLFCKGMAVKAVKIAGHSGNPLNELADQMAVKEAEKRKGGTDRAGKNKKKGKTSN